MFDFEPLPDSEAPQDGFFVNRWYDEDGVPHYFGIHAPAYNTLAAAQKAVKFNVIDTPTDIVYGPCSLQECFDFMRDVLVYPPGDDLADIGSLGWKS
jgi:hypothetical protein